MNENGKTKNEKLSCNEEKKQIIRKVLANSQVTDEELEYFAITCDRTGLDPFAKQIYLTHRGSKMVIMTSIDGFRVVSQRSGQYLGQVGPFWCGEDGKWTDVGAKGTTPTAAKVTVSRILSGHVSEVSAVAHWSEYHPSHGANMWRQLPRLMIAKCAEALALRKAFPNDLSGLYTDEEMEQSTDSQVSGKGKPIEPVTEDKLFAEVAEEPVKINNPVAVQGKDVF